MIEIHAGGADVRGTVDFVRNIRSGTQDGRLVAARADSLLVEGWALQRLHPADGVFVLLDGAPVARMVGGINRPDLPAVFGEGTDHGGYRGIVSLRGLAAGERDLVVVAGDAVDGFAEIGRRRLLVTEPAPPLPGAELSLELDGWTGEAHLGAHVTLRGRLDRNGADYDGVAAIVDDRYVINGRFTADGPAEAFEVVLRSEQFGLGTVRVRVAAFAGSVRYDARDNTVLRISLDQAP